MRYFVCFCYEEKDKTGFGHTAIEMDDAVMEYGDIIEMERRLEEKIGIGHPIILDYKPLGSPTFEYARYGDTETLRAMGGSMMFQPHIDVKVNSGIDAGMDTGKIAGAIAEMLGKMLISKGQE